MAAVAWILMPQPVMVETARVTSGRFVATVDEDGKARMRERYVVAAPLAGRSTRVGLKVGDRGEAGDAPPSPSCRRSASRNSGSMQ